MKKGMTRVCQYFYGVMNEMNFKEIVKRVLKYVLKELELLTYCRKNLNGFFTSCDWSRKKNIWICR